jgi:hypothetical protein
MTIELVPLATARIVLREPLVLEGTPMGNRMIFEVAEAEFFGDRLSGKLKGQAAADWLLVGPNNVGTLDIRATIETHDGALIYSAYKGRTDLSRPGSPIYVAPLYDTGDNRYLWLSKIQCVGKGFVEDNILNYELYELR